MRNVFATVFPTKVFLFLRRQIGFASCLYARLGNNVFSFAGENYWFGENVRKNKSSQSPGIRDGRRVIKAYQGVMADVIQLIDTSGR